MSRRAILLIILLSLTTLAYGQRHHRGGQHGDSNGAHNVLKGRVIDANTKKALAGAVVTVEGTTSGATVDEKGKFRLLLHRKYSQTQKVRVMLLGYETQSREFDFDELDSPVTFELQPSIHTVGDVEVFGERYVQPDKIDYITRMPLRPSEQIQTISIISEKLNVQQANHTLADAARNVAGVSTFSTFGGSSESLTIRGFRGLPVLKNGVRIHSDFRGGGTLTEMQGVESVQVIKGSAAITQGIGNDLASAGGVLNIATKTPKFVNRGEVSLQSGSWGKLRPTFDVEHILTSNGNLSIRLNGAYERSDNFRKFVSSNRVYINPSIAWRPDHKTMLVFEMDYLYDSRTPDRGTVNLGNLDENKLLDLSHNKFLGFTSDRLYTTQTNFSLRFTRQLSDKLSFRVAAVASELDTDNMGMSYEQQEEKNRLNRYIGRSLRDDGNRLLQVDLIGRDVMTWGIQHTFQVGFDYRYTNLTTTRFGVFNEKGRLQNLFVDEIDVLSDFGNTLPANAELERDTPLNQKSYSYGLMAQDVITFTPYLKAVLGLRYSYQENKNSDSPAYTKGDAFNPMVGLIVSPLKNLHIFGSYTTTTDLRSSANLMEDGSTIGKSTIDQFEAGVKGEWFDGRLRTNLTLFHVNNANLAYLIYDDTGASTNRYGKAGDLRRQGVEFELSGRILENLQAILGYAYLDVEYRNSKAYEDGSAPMNAPKHTANGWLFYTFNRGALKNLSLGVGAYYVGKRPVNDYTKRYTHVGVTPGVKPFDMKAYTTINASVAYQYKQVGINLVFKNIFNTLGYSSYMRGGYINPIDPFNFSVGVNYKF